MDAALDGRVLGRQSERVPAERMQHVVAAQPLRARHDVADDVVANVPDVRVTRRVREHLEAVVLRPGRIFSDFEGLRAGPAFLPLLVEGLRFDIRPYAKVRLKSDSSGSNVSVAVRLQADLADYYSFQYLLCADRTWAIAMRER